MLIHNMRKIKRLNEFDSLNEDDKVNVYKYLNELEEKIRKLEKLPLMVFENNND